MRCPFSEFIEIIFVFGNKDEGKGKGTENAGGVKREFLIALEKGLFPNTMYCFDVPKNLIERIIQEKLLEEKKAERAKKFNERVAKAAQEIINKENSQTGANQ